MIRAVSLFCGVGGFDAGMFAAARVLGVDLRVVAAYDTSAKAVEVYNRNHEPVAVVADVKHLAAKDLTEHDLIFGGPPCQDHSLAGKRRCRCHLGEEPTARCCIRDFVRLVSDSPAWIMENVMPLLYPNAPWSEPLCALDYGDVTTRKRWFYSSHLLHVVPTPSARRLRDIRDHEADRNAVDRAKAVARKKAMEETRQARSYNFPPRDEEDALGSLGSSVWHRVQSGSTLVAMREGSGARHAIDETEPIGSLTADSWHGTNQGGASMVAVRSVQSRPSAEDQALGSLTSSKGGVPEFLKVGLRGHSASASASAFDDDEPLGTITANAWHANERGKLGPSVRCPSLLEMQRAHSFPDDFDWAGATKTQRGLFIANSVPQGIATALGRAMFVAMGATRENVA